MKTVKMNPKFKDVGDVFSYKSSGEKYSPVALFAGGKRLILRSKNKPEYFNDYVVSTVARYFTFPKKVMEAILEEVKRVNDGDKIAIKSVIEIQYWIEEVKDA